VVKPVETSFECDLYGLNQIFTLPPYAWHANMPNTVVNSRGYSCTDNSADFEQWGRTFSDSFLNTTQREPVLGSVSIVGGLRAGYGDFWVPCLLNIHKNPQVSSGSHRCAHWMFTGCEMVCMCSTVIATACEACHAELTICAVWLMRCLECMNCDECHHRQSRSVSVAHQIFNAVVSRVLELHRALVECIRVEGFMGPWVCRTSTCSVVHAA